jgi:hypothetical protein
VKKFLITGSYPEPNESSQHTLPSYFSKFHFNIIILSMPEFSKQSHPFTFSCQFLYGFLVTPILFPTQRTFCYVSLSQRYKMTRDLQVFTAMKLQVVFSLVVTSCSDVAHHYMASQPRTQRREC